MEMRAIAIGAALAGALAMSPRARADECKLAPLADLQVTIEERRASVPIRINDHHTVAWIDSGAFFSTMSAATAAEFGLRVGAVPGESDFTMIGIGGSAAAGFTRVKSFGFAKFNVANVGFIVGGSDTGRPLLGANTLSFADTEFDLAHGSIKLFQPQGNCRKAMLAYWAKGIRYFVVSRDSESEYQRKFSFTLPVSINGVQIEAMIDSGARSSLLSRNAAARAGIKLDGPEASAVDGFTGFGRRSVRGWTVPVTRVSIGDEMILNARLDVIDGPIVAGSNVDMLLGFDFLMAHRILFARSQNLVYLTYVGGKPFIGSAQADAAGVAAAAPPSIPKGMHRVEAETSTAPEPTAAADLARRAALRLAREDKTGAIADYTAAIALSPATASYYRDRAKAYGENDQDALAGADIEKALALDPGDADLLRTRAWLRLDRDDRAGALADTDAAARLTPPTSLDAREIADLYGRLRLYRRAIEVEDKVIALHRQDVGFGSMLNGRCWFRALGAFELDAALADCNQAIKRSGAQPDILDSRALVYLRQKNYRAAIADYDAVLKADPKFARARYMRGVVRIAAGDAAGGKADQDAAVAADAKVVESLAKDGLPGGA